MTQLAVITDGTPPAVALGRWLEARAPAFAAIEARAPAEVPRLVQARRRSGSKERIVVIGGSPAGADIDGTKAWATVAEWLRGMPPIEARHATDRIEAMRASGQDGADTIEELLALLAPIRPKLPHAKRGRPAGRDPFSGAGFDVTVSLLVDPLRRWTERDLAEATGRAPSLVHKNLEELARRGHLSRMRGGTNAKDATALRQDLLGAWRAKVGSARAARLFTVRRGQDPLMLLSQAARRHAATLILAGPSAVTGAARLLGEPVTVYLTRDADAVLEDVLEPAARLGDVAVWSPAERGIFLFQRKVRGFSSTNRVVTWLDLMLSGTDRGQAAAEQFWEETGRRG